MTRTIRYAIHRDEGTIISQVGDMLAWPVLDYEAIGQHGDFTAPFRYTLAQVPVLSVGREWARLKWTRKVPAAAKHLHRQFWGFRPRTGAESRG